MFKINCLYCNKLHRTKKSSGKFCSISCGSKWNHENNINFKKTLKNLKNDTKEKILKKCSFCNKEYFVRPCQNKRTKYCSKTCKSSAIYNKYKNKMIENAKKVCTGRIAPNRGIPHKKEALKKIMAHSSKRPNGYWGISYKPYVCKNGKKLNLKSSYEILFVEFLEKNNIDFEYEPEQFLLDNGKAYIPDFYIPSQNKWYEIKGYANHKSIEKYNLFKKKYGHFNICILYSKDLEEKFNIDLSCKSLKNIRNKWRNLSGKDKTIDNKRSSVDKLAASRSNS
jgi:hypothetical protein